MPVQDPRGYVSQPRLPHAAAIALAACHDFESGESLAKLLKLVPYRFVSETEIRCLCGGVVSRSSSWTECPGGCGRVFVADEFSAWAARLPVEP